MNVKTFRRFSRKSLGSLSSCGEVGGADDHFPQQLMDSMDLRAYLETIDNRMQMWDAQIRLLEARVQHVGIDAPHWATGVRVLRRKWQTLSHTLRVVTSGGDELWGSIIENVERAFSDLQQSLEALGTISFEERGVE